VLDANRIHPRTEAEKNLRASQRLKELELKYGGYDSATSMTLDQARAKTAILITENRIK